MLANVDCVDFHIDCYLKENANKLNYLTQILGEHWDFNIINFGEELWNSVIKPSLTHGPAIWMPLSMTSMGAFRKFAISCSENCATK